MTLPLRVTVAPERADASPGDNLQFDVTVRNASDIVEHYGVELLGLPDGATVRTEPDVAKLRPAESGTLTVRVNLPVQPPAPAGTYMLGALVRSKYRHDVSRCVEVPMELASVEQITVKTTPEVVTGGRSGQYIVEAANGGNAPVRLYLTATDPERRVVASFQPPILDLPPGASGQSLLAVEAQLPWNKETRRQLTIAAAPDSPGAVPITGTATFIQQPRFASKFVKVAAIAAGVVVVAAAIAVPALLTHAKDNATAAPAPSVIIPTLPTLTPTSAAAPPPVASLPPSVAAPTSAAAGGGGQPSSAPVSSAPVSSAPVSTGRTVDLTAPAAGIVASDTFSNQGFLVGGSPGTIAVAGCANATAAAEVQDPAAGKFLTSSSPDDPTKCHDVPLMLDFPPDSPAGALSLTPLQPGAVTMRVAFKDLVRQDAPTLSVPADLAKQHGGVDFVLISPAVPGQPVAVTKLTLSAL